MTKPVIFVIDDDTVVLNAVDRDMRQRYGQDYRILNVNSGHAALLALEQLLARSEPVALFMVDQRMPRMTGTQFLAQARQVFPGARRVMLTAYADSEALIEAINIAGVEHYLMKPWNPPDERLYPVVDRLLQEWQQRAA